MHGNGIELRSILMKSSHRFSRVYKLPRQWLSSQTPTLLLFWKLFVYSKPCKDKATWFLISIIFISLPYPFSNLYRMQTVKFQKQRLKVIISRQSGNFYEIKLISLHHFMYKWVPNDFKAVVARIKGNLSRLHIITFGSLLYGLLYIFFFALYCCTTRSSHRLTVVSKMELSD